MTDEAIVHVVDDDEAVRRSLAFLLDSAGLRVNAHESAAKFLDQADSLGRGCILIDVRMPDIDGLELQQKLIERGVTLPVIVMTGHADVPIAVQALKAGAVDFIEKPFDDEVLIAAVQSALEKNRRDRRSETEMTELAHRWQSLTPREHEILTGLVAGNPNKTIAFDLGISARTVEVHRARVMEKMHARSLSELVRMSLALDPEQH